MRKYRTKLKSSLKKWVNLREVQNDGGFLQYKLSDRDMVSKTLPGDLFSSTITHMKIFQKFMKKFFVEFLAFFQISLIFTYIFLTKLCTKKDLNNDWTELCSNESVLPKLIKFEQIVKSLFRNIIFISFGRTDSFEHSSIQSLFKSFFVHNLVTKI